MSAGVDIDRDKLTISGERMIRYVGNSAVLTIPPEILRGTGLEEGDDVIIEGSLEDGTISVKRAPDEDESEEDKDEEENEEDTDEED